MKVKNILLTLAGIFLLSTVFYADDIHEFCKDSNLDLVESLEGLVDSFLGTILDLLPYLLEHKFVDPALFGLYLKIGSKANLTKILSYVVVTGYLNSILKSIYSLPRPFMEYPDELEYAKCSYSLGAPSDYGMSGVVIYVTGYWLYIRDFQTDLLSENAVRLLKKAYIFLACFIIFGGCLSRVAMGLHSYDQIILGLLYGIFFQVFYIQVVDRYLDYVVKYLIVKRHTNRRFILYILIYSLIISLLLTTGIYLIKRTDPIYVEYYEIMAEICDPHEWVFMENHYISSFKIVSLIAFYIGLTLLPHREPFDRIDSISKGILRFIIYWASVFGISRLFPSEFTDNIWIEVFVIDLPYYFIIGINAALIFPFLFKYIKLQSGNDFLEEEYKDDQIVLREDYVN